MQVKFNNLYQQYLQIKDQVLTRIDKLFTSSAYINGPDVKIFENNFANYVGTKYAIGTSNGTDAIALCSKALSILYPEKTLYIIPTNTFIATYLGIVQGNPQAEILTVDCDQYYQINIEDLTKELKLHRHKYKRCVIVGVHLYGCCCDVKSILNLCEQYDCMFFEDSSQSHGTLTQLGYTGSIGLLSAFSLYPGKNLGACGDAGIITTNNDDIYNILIKLRNFGAKDKYTYDYQGCNNRLDTIQAIILDEKLKFLNRWNYDRSTVAYKYNSILKNVVTPLNPPYCMYNVYHVYPIRVKSSSRNRLQDYLKSHDIETVIHYPTTLEQIPCLNLQSHSIYANQYSHELLSLPIHPFLTNEETSYVCETINAYPN